jgi:hypothetical protein
MGSTSSTNGGSGGITYIYNNQNGTTLLTTNGGQGGFTAPGNGNTNGGIGGISRGTIGTLGGENMNLRGQDGRVGGGGGGSNSHIIPVKGGDGVNNISINDPDFINIIQNVIQNLISNDSNFTNTLQNLIQNSGYDLPNNMSFDNLSQLTSILSKNGVNLNFAQIFGTGGGAGNAGLYEYININRNTILGGRSGKSGGITVGFGGIGPVLGNENGENGSISIPYLGGGGGGGGGGSGNGTGGSGTNGGSGSVILFFNT